MRRLLLIAAILITATPAVAQDVPGLPQPPPMPPPILPKIEIPQVPRMDAPPAQPGAKQPRETFQDRAIRCQHQAGLAGMNPAEAAAYTRACANR